MPIILQANRKHSCPVSLQIIESTMERLQPPSGKRSDQAGSYGVASDLPQPYLFDITSK